MKKEKLPKKGEIVIYQSKEGSAKLKVKLQNETIWLTQKQIAELFGTQRPAITKHLNNIFKNKELNEKSVSSILEHTALDGKIYKTRFYNLDAIISIGYRVNSRRATQFRIWATDILRNHIVKGFTINQKRLKSQSLARLNELEKAVGLFKNAIGNKRLNRSEAAGLLDVITNYANSWVLLQKYDKGELIIKKGKIKKVKIVSYNFGVEAIKRLKKDLISKKQASELFGQERDGGLQNILKNLEQTFGGKSLYPSIEEKAAHLFYFVIKDHPFVDGNKRIASFLFVVFLSQNNYLLDKKGDKKINDNTLVALALLIAESNPAEKDTMLALVTNIL